MGGALRALCACPGTGGRGLLRTAPEGAPVALAPLERGTRRGPCPTPLPAPGAAAARSGWSCRPLLLGREGSSAREREWQGRAGRVPEAHFGPFVLSQACRVGKRRQSLVPGAAQG